MEDLFEEGLLHSRIVYDPPKDGANMAKSLYEAFKQHSDRTLLVDAGNKQSWTGAQLSDVTARIASNLIKQAGLRVDDVVLTICDHASDEIIFALGVVLAGCALYGSGVNDGYEEEKILCELVKPNAIIVNSRLHEMVLKLKENVAGLENTRIVWIDNPMKLVHNQQLNDDANNNCIIDNNNNNNSSIEYYNEIIERDQVILFDQLKNASLDEGLIKKVIYERIKPKEHIVTYMLTSGSTGRPKVVPSTHEELIHGIQSMLSSSKYIVGSADNKLAIIEEKTSVPSTDHSNHSTKKLNGHFIKSENDDDNNNQLLSSSDLLIFPITKESIFSGDLPLDHGAGVNTMFLSFIVGSKYVVIKSYDEDTFWQAVNDYKITTSIASTTFTYKLMVRLKSVIDSGQTNKWNLNSLKLISCAGAKLTFTDLIKKINKVYTHISIRQCYGCTEIGFMAMLNGKDCKPYIQSVGHLFPGLIAKVVDRDSGKILGPNERGELMIWSNSKFKGYKCHKNDNSRKLFKDCHDEKGFYKTGDQVHYDEEMRFYIHGRFKDTLFLMEDWKILPAELEEVIDQYPLVEFSTVIGIPDPDLPGCDAPKAFLKLISPSSKEFEQVESRDLREKLILKDYNFISRDVYNFVAQKTAKPKHLKGGVRILETFPRVGLLNKIDRKALKLID